MYMFLILSQNVPAAKWLSPQPSFKRISLFYKVLPGDCKRNRLLQQVWFQTKPSIPNQSENEKLDPDQSGGNAIHC